MDIKELHRAGHSIRAICHMSGVSRNSVRGVLRERIRGPFAQPARGSKLDPFKSYIDSRLRECPLSAVRLAAEIEPMGYCGSLDIVQRYIKTFRVDARAMALATVRFETPPGAQAQVDWAHCGRILGCDNSLVYAFVMVLSFSRAMYVEFTDSMDTAILLECHKRAFAYFGGWPRTLLYDNMKQVRVGPDRLNPQLTDFANHYGFAVKTHRPYRPRTKGKVERMVSYVRDNFLTGRNFADRADLSAQVRHWLDYTANVRTHGTTDRRPVDLLPGEGLASMASAKPYPVGVYASRSADAEGFVHFGGSRYSVAPEHVGKTVSVAHVDGRIVLRVGGSDPSGSLIIAEHNEAPRSGSCVANPAHVAQFWKLSTKTERDHADEWLRSEQQDLAERRHDSRSQSVEVRSLSLYEQEAA